MDTTAAPSVALIPPRPSRLADQTDQTDLADVPPMAHRMDARAAHRFS